MNLNQIKEHADTHKYMSVYHCSNIETPPGNKRTWSKHYWEQGNKRKIKLRTREQSCVSDVLGNTENQNGKKKKPF